MSNVIDFPVNYRENDSFIENKDMMVKSLLSKGLPKTEEEYKKHLEFMFGISASIMNRWICDTYDSKKFSNDSGYERRSNLQNEVSLWLINSTNKVIEGNNDKPE